jgi:hypothetical protein
LSSCLLAFSPFLKSSLPSKFACSQNVAHQVPLICGFAAAALWAPSIHALTSAPPIVVSRGGGVVASVNDDAALKDLGGERALIGWAVGRGARVSDAIIVRDATPASPRGLFAVRAVEEGDELIMLPERLQCGVNGLAAGADMRLQQMVGELNIGFQTVRCAVALCAEVRLGSASFFHAYIEGLPTPSNLWAPDPTGSGWGYDSSATSDETPELRAYPSVAASATSMRAGLRTLHARHAPPELSLHELCWAASIASSRAFKVRAPVGTDEQAARLGWRATDTTRLLPLIDLANHAAGEGANAALGDTSRQPWKYSVRLVATRAIAVGEEVTLDYGGGGKPISNERLLLEYGFLGGEAGGATKSAPASSTSGESPRVLGFGEVARHFSEL